MIVRARTLRDEGSRGREGSTLFAVTMAVVGLAVFSVGVLQLGLSNTREQLGSVERVNAQYAAEAAVAAAAMDMSLGGDGMVFTEDAPLQLGGATAFLQVVDLGADGQQVSAGGTSGNAKLGVQTIVDQVTSSVFAFAAFGDEGVHMDSNAFVDSYDSTLGAYTASNGSGTSAHAGTNGTVGSNGNVEMDQNSQVYGSVVPGPDGTAIVLGNAYVTGTTTSSEQTVAMPTVEPPAGVSLGDVIVPKLGTGSLPSGTNIHGNLLVESGATLTLTGPATYVFDNFELGSGAEVKIDDTNGPVEIFVNHDFLINANTLVASLDFEPADVSFVVLSDNIIEPELEVDLDEVDFDSNAKMYASILAPNASIVINSNFELYGALAAKKLVLDSNCKIHYDESLADSSKYSSTEWEIVGWRLTGYPTP